MNSKPKITMVDLPKRKKKSSKKKKIRKKASKKKSASRKNERVIVLSKPGPKGGRPASEINLDTVQTLARMQCTLEEISAVLGICRATLYAAMKKHPVIKETIELGRNYGKASLRRKQFEVAQQGNTPMLMFLGKNYLGQFDRQVFEGEVTVEEKQPIINITTPQLPPELQKIHNENLKVIEGELKDISNE